MVPNPVLRDTRKDEEEQAVTLHFVTQEPKAEEPEFILQLVQDDLIGIHQVA